MASAVNVRIYFAGNKEPISERLAGEYLAMMPARICQSISQYKRWQDRQAMLIGRLLLLRALRIKFGDAGIQKFASQEVGTHGKPFIHGGPEFNIAHSGAIVILAIADDGVVGIDIEEVRTIDIKDFSRHLPEVAHLCDTCDVRQANTLFFDCWTRKEAVLKGCGEGLSAPLDSVVLKEDAALFENKPWYLKKLFIAEGYCCHVATEQPLQNIAIEQVNVFTGVC